MSEKEKKQAALDYHAAAPAGKIEVQPTKSVSTQSDLSLAYSPGVAAPCLAIKANREDVYKYTAKGNLVAVISNGTAVLGLGDIGPEASKPVMEGKAVLFKKFAGIDVFDLEIDEKDPEAFIKIVKSLAPTFGGINLEDIKAPESFLIEETLHKELSIPVMHDDQHGTAIVSAAALLSAVDIVGKPLETLKIVINGAGAAAIACANLQLSLGVRAENIVMLDSQGVIRKDREGLSSMKAKYATTKDVNTLSEAIVGADMFLGLSRGNVLVPDMLLKMSKDPIVFALANPDPEIKYSTAMDTRPDVIMATGRSDHPNQINNVLGFPSIFRGALDVQAKCINEEMKLAAVAALAKLAKEPVPSSVVKAYGKDRITFGRDYLLPTPLDPRLVIKVAPAVARAAMKSRVSRLDIYDWKAYEQDLRARIGVGTDFLANMAARAAKAPKRVALTDAENPRVIQAARLLLDEGIAQPVLLGDRRKVLQLFLEHKISQEGIKIIDPAYETDLCQEMAVLLHEKRKRRGITLHRARHLVPSAIYFGALLLEMGKVDALISGSVADYAQILRVVLEVIGVDEGVKHTAGMQVMCNAHGTYFMADTSVNITPDAECLAEIVSLSVDFVRRLDYEPRVAMLSYVSFGASKSKEVLKVREALALIKKRTPELVIDGEMQAHVALSPELLKGMYSFSALDGKPANVLICPNLAAGNIAHKLLIELAGFDSVGPVLMGMRKAVHILQQGASAREIFNLTAFAVLDAQGRAEK